MCVGSPNIGGQAGPLGRGIAPAATAAALARLAADGIARQEMQTRKADNVKGAIGTDLRPAKRRFTPGRSVSGLVSLGFLLYRIRGSVLLASKVKV